MKHIMRGRGWAIIESTDGQRQAWVSMPRGRTLWFVKEFGGLWLKCSREYAGDFLRGLGAAQDYREISEG